MGSGSSRYVEWANLENHPLVQRLVTEKITSADPLWNQFLSFQVPLLPKFNPEHDKGMSE
jgi:hypothetical protein